MRYIILALTIILLKNNLLIAQIAPNLGMCGQYGLLSGSNIVSNYYLNINGKCGASGTIDTPITSNYGLNTMGSGNVPQAIIDLNLAMGFCSGQAGSNLSGLNNNQTLNAGVYNLTGNVILHDTITLNGNGQDVFIININGNFLIDTNAIINYSNVNPQNIFWNINGNLTVLNSNLFAGVTMVNGTISWQNDNFARATLLANNNIEFANMNGISLELLFASYTNMVAQTPCVNPNIPICNLIQNGNFEFINPGFIVNTTAELYKACPWNNAATSWNNGTSDLYRSNATGCFVQVPQQKIIACTTLISEQDDINLLDAYAGIVVWDQPNNWREYLQQHLLSPLVANKKYYVEFWSSLHDASENAIDQIGMHLSTTPDVQFGSFPIILTPQINSPAGVVMDNRLIWNRISGCYTALGNEEYITIGNFTANANTAVSNVTTLGSYSLGPLAYYFIDEVTIVPFEVEAGPDKGACGVPVQIGIPNCLTPYASAPYNSITYSWAPATGLSSTSIFNPIASPITTTSYTVTATTSTGCTTTDVVVVNVGTSPPPIQLTQSATDIFCPNTAVNVSVNTNFGWTYLWSGGQNSNSIIVNNAGTYTVTVTNTYGCSSTLSTTINSYPCCTSPITAPVNITLNNSSSGQLMNNFPQFVINGSNPPVFNPGLSPIIINGTFIVNQSIDIWSADIQLGPNAQIIVNPGISFYLSKECYLHSCNGLYMWQGIKLLNDAVLNVTTCLIEDAKQAIYSDLHCFIYINKNSMLNRNYENIVLSNSAFTALDFIFRESIISCNASTWLPGVGGQINFNANATLITPHSNQRTLSGININNILDITIGWQFVGANPSSRFNNMDYGIYSQFSNSNVFHIDFTNIESNVVKPGTKGSAIYAKGSANVNFNIVIGGNATTDMPNSFINCSRGVFLDQYMSSEISYNTFDHTYQPNLNFNNTAINIYYPVNRPHLIHHNILNNFRNGIVVNGAFTGNVNFPFEIHDNILNGSQNGITSPPYAQWGIRVANAFPGDPFLRLFNNKITDARIAISCEYVIGLQITGDVNNRNEIYFNIPNALVAQNHYGIWLDKCDNASVNYALIQKNNTPNLAGMLSMQGIKIDGSSTVFVNQCEMNNMCSGLRVSGQCTGTEFHCNDFDMCNIGIRLEGANLPPHGTANQSWGNEWYNMPIYNNRINGATFNGTAIDWFYSGANQYPGNAPNVVNPLIASATAPCVGLLAADDPENIETEVDAAIDGSGNNSNSDASFLQNDFAYNQLLRDSTMLNPADSNYTFRIQFLSSVANTCIGKFRNLNTAISNFDSAGCWIIFNTISPTNYFEQNLYDCYFIYLSTFAIGLVPDSIQTNKLEEVASMTPMMAGPAVYSARAMLAWEQDDVDGSLKMMFNSTTTELINQFVFPNPTGTILYFSDFATMHCPFKYVVQNATGVVVKEGELFSHSPKMIDVSKLANGLYHISGYTNDGTIFMNEKVVILK